MANRLIVAGMKLLYAVEAVAGTMPTAMSAFTPIPEVTGAPNMFPEPNTEDVTPIDETSMVQYVDLLRDFGGSLPFPCNWNDAVATAWAGAISAYATGIAADKATWWCIYHPSLSKAVYFKGKPIESGFGELSANTALKGELRIVPEGGWTYTTAPSTS